MSSSSCILKDKFLTALKNNTLVAECENIASEVQKGDVKLYNFVEGLQPLLTNENVDFRKQSIQALSSLLSSLPTDFLSEAELSFIIDFYCDRLKDHYSLLPVTLKGILSIVQMKNLPQDGPVRLFTAIFQHVQCQTLLLPDRQVMYRIFEILLRCKSSNLKSLGYNVVVGFINSIDGESDPRNLVILFRIIPYFVKEFSLGHLTEEMFEVIACYFPVHYNSPKSEGCGITRENLAELLAPCLCAIPEFAEFCLPLLIEKLDSNLKVAKLDSLNVLSQGVQTFGVKRLEPHLQEIWQSLQREIMQNDDSEVKSSALKTLTLIIKVLCEDEIVCNNFVDNIITNAKWTLCNTPINSSKNAEKVLEAIAKTNEALCIQVMCIIVPVCLLQYSTKNSLQDKLFLIETFNNFIVISSKYELSIKNIPDLAWADVPSFYLEELNTNVLEIQIKVLQGLIAQRISLNETQRAIVYEKILNEMETGKDNMLQAFHCCFYSFAELYPNEILNTIESRFSINDRNATARTISRRIEALSSVAKIPKIGSEILPKFIDAAISNNVEVNLTALSCIRKLLTTKAADFDIYRSLHEQDIINRLLTSSISHSDQGTYLISNICRLIVRKLSIQEQEAALKRYNRVLKGMVSDTDVALIDGFLISLHPDVELNTDILVRNLYELAVNSLNSAARDAACKLTAVLLNKMKENEDYELIMQFLKKNISNCLESKEIEIEVKQAHCVLLRWLTKSLVMKGSANSQDFLNYQMITLNHIEVGEYVANEFNALVNRFEDTLTEDNFCQVKILYKQRIFENILTESSNASCDSKKNYLTALIHMTEEVPIELLLLYLKELVPCFVSSLTTEELIIPTLTVLHPLLETKNDIFVLQAKYFIHKLLDLTSHDKMKIRIAALNCLISYARYPSVIINSFKLDVLEKLHFVTDDPKRLVRKLAVTARIRWFLIDSDVKT